MFCVAYDGDSPIINIWEYLSGGQPTEDPGFIEAMGFAGMTDEVRILKMDKFQNANNRNSSSMYLILYKSLFVT